ncbi:5-oxoprolinase subunit PxpA, partial [Vibrio sp.]|nr:5-oxoprolinase subunit PxpA [Vibrio sp.]
GADHLVMPYIDMANIACGFHASDPTIMQTTVQLAIQNDVMIGAHPGYPDLQGFGRRSITMPMNDITQMLLYQVGALSAICQSEGGKVEYIKPHGALYNDMMKDIGIFEAITKAAAALKLPLMVLAKGNLERHRSIAKQYHVPLIMEAFSDRAYLDNGELTPRSLDGAVLSQKEDILNQVLSISKNKEVTSLTGSLIPLQADTICVHGDNEASIALIKDIKQSL